MKKIAVIASWCESSIDVAIEIMRALGPESVVFFCNAEFMHNNPERTKEVRSMGIQIHEGAPQSTEEHPYILCDARYLHTHPVQSSYTSGFRRIVYTQGMCATPIQQGDFLLSPSEAQLLASVNDGTLLLDADDYTQWGACKKGGEATLVGLIPPRDWPQQDAERKTVIKKQLMQRLDIPFDASRPLIIFYEDIQMDTQATCKTLRHLAEKAIIAVRPSPLRQNKEILKQHFAAPKSIIFIDEEQYYDLPLLLAADAILSGFNSDEFIHSIMLGLLTIPVFTQYVTTCNAHGNAQTMTFVRFLQDYEPSNALEIFEMISPLNVEAVDMLWKRITSKSYRALYEENIADFQTRIFGMFSLHNAVKDAVKHIRNIMQHGSMLPVSLARLGKKVQGPRKIRHITERPLQGL